MRLLIIVSLFLLSASFASAQAHTSDLPAWQRAAGDSVAFEVASIREDKGPFKPPTFALSNDDWFRDPHGRFHADFSLLTYVQFAYKVSLTGEEEHAVMEKLPEWVKSARFDIEATAPLNATKDQYRVMMQKLLADRFQLKVHFEQREMPVLAMVLVKQGLPGPRLIPHERGLPCGEKPQAEIFPAECYGYQAKPSRDGMYIAGARATSMDLIANFIGNQAGYSGDISRRVVDRTGLTGPWDFTVEAAPPHQQQAQEGAGTAVLEAVRNQLGITLKPARATISTLVIDHVDLPSEN